MDRASCVTFISDMRKILIVDDNVDVLFVLERMLSIHLKGFFNVDIAHSGEEAYDLVQNHSYEMILSDLDMPNGSGLWLLQNVDHKNIPVVILSGGHKTISKDELLKAGAVEYIEKPYSIESLVEAIYKYVKDIL